MEYKKCLNCESPIKGKVQTCSRQCADEYKKRNSREIRKCSVCNANFEVRKKVIKSMCSDKCRTIWNARPENKKQRIQKSKESLIEKYGTDKILGLQAIRDKAAQTSLEIYGDSNYRNVHKAKQTKKERFGDENYNNLEKNRATKFEKYNDVNFNDRQKAKETMQKKYGVEHAMKLSVFQNKRKESFKEDYGVEFPLQSSEIKSKQEKTNVERYGFASVSQNDKVKQKIKQSYWEKFDSTILFDKMKSSNIMLVDKYEGIRIGTIYTTYSFQCLTCANMFSGTFNNNRPPVCRVCFPSYKNNKQQIEIREFLNEHLIKFEENVRYIISPFELDLYFPDHNLAIEMNGNYYHSEIGGEKDKNYHLNKTKLCNNKQIELIHIFEDEWMFQKNIVKSMILNRLGKTSNKIFARKCNIANVNGEDKKRFLDSNHIQGNTHDKVRKGLYYNGSLVAIMTFSKLRISLGNITNSDQFYELVRFCTINNTHIVGGFSKLLKSFINEHKPVKIVSFADCRFAGLNPKNTVYYKQNFQFTYQNNPRYWYFKKGDYLTRYHRFQFKKGNLLKLLNRQDLSEWDIAQLLGMDRIWDCGNLRFEINL